MKNKFSCLRCGSTSCIRGKRLLTRPQRPHGRERTKPRLIHWKYFSAKAPARNHLVYGTDSRNHLELTQLANAESFFQLNVVKIFDASNFNSFILVSKPFFIVNFRWFLKSVPYARGLLAGAFTEKYFQCISILASVLFVLYREALW